MIVGIGTDIVQIDRIAKILNKYQEAFLQKILHPEELEYYATLQSEKTVSYLAKRFAAKEAFSKAMGSGIGHGLAFNDIAILNNKSGAPYIYIDSAIEEKYVGQKFHISLSDDYPIAVAFVVISK